MQRRFLALAVNCGLLVLAGCETTTPDADTVLSQARSAVAEAQGDPNVTRYSAAELEQARKLLINAEGAARQRGANDKIAVHYAYLATQVARISEQRAHEQVAVARIKAGEAERQQILSTRQNEASQAQTDTQWLAAQLQNVKAAQTPRGIVLTLDDVLFDTGRTHLKPGAQHPLDQIAQFLGEHPERRVQIEAFTDSQGSNDYNIELSQSRADAVAMAIMQRGVQAERVRAMGYGEGFPVASNDNAGGRQLNRRVEIIVSNDARAVPTRIAAGAP